MMNTSEIASLNQELQQADSKQILKRCADLFPNKIAFASSLGFEDQLITHFIASENLPIEVFTLDTGRVFPETYDLIERTNARYNINIKIMFPDAKEVEEMVNKKGGVNLFYESIENRKQCCGIRKTKPLERALKNLDAGLQDSDESSLLRVKICKWWNGMPCTV